MMQAANGLCILWIAALAAAVAVPKHEKGLSKRNMHSTMELLAHGHVRFQDERGSIQKFLPEKSVREMAAPDVKSTYGPFSPEPVVTEPQVSRCDTMCNEMGNQSWLTKCSWYDCNSCSECSDQFCKATCIADAATWDIKCDWNTCWACPSCRVYVPRSTGECPDYKMIKSIEECAGAAMQLYNYHEHSISNHSDTRYAAGCYKYNDFASISYWFNDLFEEDGPGAVQAWSTDSGVCGGAVECICRKR